MNLGRLAAFIITGLTPFLASAGDFEYEYSGRIRAIGSYNNPAKNRRTGQDRSQFIGYVNLFNALKYNFNDNTFLELSASVKGKSRSSLDNLNQGLWGEEVYAHLAAAYGDFYLGQMPNAAIKFGVNQPDYPIWVVNNSEIADFINNPNWQQHKRTKYYNTLDSTLIGTDGSALKFSYLSPEFYGTALGFSYIPQNNANDGLVSKFAPYADKDAYVVSMYTHYELAFAEAQGYLSYADFKQSHQEYAGGFSLTRKSWTLFASYRQTDTSRHDYPLAKTDVSANMPAYFDGFRRGRAWNGGIGYEQAFLSTVLTYFESSAVDSSARNKIISWHTRVKPYKHLGFYGALAYVDFKTNHDNIEKGNRGSVVYGGIELSF